MPQMAPLSWMNLFIVFSLTMTIFNSMNYFTFKHKLKKMNNKKTLKKINWKW